MALALSIELRGLNINGPREPLVQKIINYTFFFYLNKYIVI